MRDRVARCGSWITLLTILLVSQVSHGQEPVARSSDLPRQSVEAPAAIGAPTQSVAGLFALWRGFLLAGDGSETEELAFSALQAARMELGLPGLPQHAMVLLREAETAQRAGDPERARILIDWAIELAPRDPAGYFSRAAQAGWLRPWKIPSILADLAKGHRLAMQSPAQNSIAGYDLLRTLLWALAGLTALFLLVQIYRYYLLASTDLASLLAHHVDISQIRVCLALLLVLPSLLWASPVLIVPPLLILFWLYQRTSERLVSLLILLGLAVLPWMVGQMGVFAASAASDAAFLYSAENDICEAHCQSRLEQLSLRHPDDAQLDITRSLVLYRSSSEVELARAFQLLSEREFEGPLRPVAHLLLANLLALRNQADAAMGLYREIIEDGAVSPSTLAAAHFNLYRLMGDRGDPARDEHLARAQALDYQGVVDLVQQGVRRLHRHLMHAGTPPRLLLDRALQQSGALVEPATRELWRPLGGRLPMKASTILVGVILALMILLLALKSRIRPSALCPRCNRIMSMREHPLAASAGYCGNCYRLFVEGSSLDNDRRVSLEQSVDRHASLGHWEFIVGNTVLAGLGYLLKGSALAGVALAGMVALGIALIACRPPVTALPFAWGSMTTDGRTALALFLLIAGYLISWATTYWRRSRP